MKIKKIDTFFVNAGWRPWIFIKIVTDSDIIGWSECSDSHGSPKGIEGVVKELGELLIGRSAEDINSNLRFLRSRTRQSPSSIIHKSIAGLENALWDILAKSLDVPVYKLFGNPLRREIPLYWSHFGTTRVRAAGIVNKPPIKNLDDVDGLVEDLIRSGVSHVKTNIPIFNDEPQIYMPGFAKGVDKLDLNLTNSVMKSTIDWIATLRNKLGRDVGISLDLNYNFTFEGIRKLSSELEKYNIAWLEIDTPNASALADLRSKINIPVTSCENLYGLGEFKPFFDNLSMDIASIDVIWNGLKTSIQLAELANQCGINICPHNYNGHISSAISMTFCSLVENFRIAEIDIDDVPWRDDLFSDHPIISDGNYILNNKPGWGVNLIEKNALKFKWDG